MKIDNSVKSVGSQKLDPQEGPKGKAASGDAPVKAGASVSLSGVASQLQAIEKNLASIGVVDTARVAEIKQAIGEGRFKINPEVIADRLLESVQEFLRARKTP